MGFLHVEKERGTSVHASEETLIVYFFIEVYCTDMSMTNYISYFTREKVLF